MERVVAPIRMKERVLLWISLAMAVVLAIGVLLPGAAGPAGAVPVAEEGKILFQGAGLQTINPDGSARSSFSPPIDVGAHPDWSGDGTKFVYVDYVDPYSSDIVISSADGTEITRVPNIPDRTARYTTLSPDGTKVAFAVDDSALECDVDSFNCETVNSSDIYTINVDGSNLTRLDSDVPSDWLFLDLDWSPDGDKIALTRWDYFVGDPDCQGCPPRVRQLSEVYTVKADGTGHPTGFADPVDGQEPGWSPDGSKIAYFGNDFDLHIMNADGTGQSRLTTDSYIGLHERAPEWSPKGTRVVFSGSESPYSAPHDLYTINVDGSNLTNITNTTNASEYSPSWQPVFADTTAPMVDAVNPADGTEGVARNTNVTATFSERMDPDTLSTSTFKLFKVNTNGTSSRITRAPVKLSADGLTAKLNPFGLSDTRLAKNTRYKAVVTTGATDVAGNALDQDDARAGNQQKVWYFTTGAS